MLETRLRDPDRAAECSISRPPCASSPAPYGALASRRAYPPSTRQITSRQRLALPPWCALPHATAQSSAGPCCRTVAYWQGAAGGFDSWHSPPHTTLDRAPYTS